MTLSELLPELMFEYKNLKLIKRLEATGMPDRPQDIMLMLNEQWALKKVAGKNELILIKDPVVQKLRKPKGAITQVFKGSMRYVFRYELD